MSMEEYETYEDMDIGYPGPPPQLLRPQPTTKSWVDRDGTRIPIRRMKDSHLCNTIRFLARRFTKIQHENYRYVDSIATAGPARFFPGYAEMVKEARRRRLLP